MSTVVSMTDKYGVTGNADFKDGRNPSDQDLLLIANKYNLSEKVKVTITDPVKSKTRFVFDVVDGKLVRCTDTKIVRKTLNEMAKLRLQEALEEITPFEDEDYNNPSILSQIDMREEDVWQEVSRRRLGHWAMVPDRYMQAMFNRVVSERAAEMYGSV